MLLERLGLDSLERMDLALHIEDRFGFRSDRVADTLGELWALAEGQLSAGEGKFEPAPAAWNVPPSDKEEPAVLGETLAEAFVRRVLKNPDDVAAADRLSGVLSYRKLYVGARLMAKRFRELQSSGHRAPRAALVGVPSAHLLQQMEKRIVGGGRHGDCACYLGLLSACCFPARWRPTWFSSACTWPANCPCC